MLLTLWPWRLTFQPQNHITFSISQGHFIHQVWSLWDHSFLSNAADKQTDKQTVSNVLLTPTDIVGVGIKKGRDETCQSSRRHRPRWISVYWDRSASSRSSGSRQYTCQTGAGTCHESRRPHTPHVCMTDYLLIIYPSGRWPCQDMHELVRSHSVMPRGDVRGQRIPGPGKVRGPDSTTC